MTGTRSTPARPAVTVRRTLAALLRVGFAGLRVSLALVAGGSYFLPWNAYPELTTSGPTALHTGYSAHGDGLLLPLLAITLAGAGASAGRRLGARWTVITEVVGIGVCAWLVGKAFDGYFEHFWLRFEFTGSAWVFYCSLVPLGIVWLVGPVVQLGLMSIRGRLEGQ